jgi:hypothetical protein
VRITRRKALAAASVAALAASVALIPTFAGGSSHREAPGIAQDPTADSTDVYAFTSPDDPNTATIIANYIPFEEPAGGPNFYGLSDNARYVINIDNTGDGNPDIAYRFRTRTTVANDESFLYATGPVSYDAATGTYRNLNVQQRYDVTRVTYRANGSVKTVRKLGRGLLSPPNNVGPKSTPNYASALVPPAINTLPGGGKVFLGQRDDPFYVDLGATFDLINIDAPGRPGIGLGDQGGGDDGLTGYNVHTIALQLPKSHLTRNGTNPTDPASTSSTIGVWTHAERYIPGPSVRKNGKLVRTGSWAQVSRLGNPLVNEVIIPLGKKDRWNSTVPAKDSQYLKYFTNPELAAAINLLFPGAVNAPTTNRQDLVAVLLKGLPPGNPTGLVTQIGVKPTISDQLRLNLAVPPSADPKRLGALAGDAAGFPNGRRLADDVVDIEEKAVGGVLAPLFGLPAPTPNAAKLGDGVDTNDQPFLTAFPYGATPLSGFDVKHPRPAS